MLKAEIKPGAVDAVREKHVMGGPLERVRIVRARQGQQMEGRVDRAEPRTDPLRRVGPFVSPWRDRKAWLKEEEQEAGLKRQSDREGVQEGLAR